MQYKYCSGAKGKDKFLNKEKEAVSPKLYLSSAFLTCLEYGVYEETPDDNVAIATDNTLEALP
jgi:hypothetical protein